MPDKPPVVFISYSHDSDQHKQKVLEFAQYLRGEKGLDIVLDQYINGAPKEGWPRWMLNQIDRAEYVLLICTPTYYRRFRGFETGNSGNGVTWEGAVITQEFYEEKCQTLKFVPVLANNWDKEKVSELIPEPLRAYTAYCMDIKNEVETLAKFIKGIGGVQAAEIGPETSENITSTKRIAPTKLPATKITELIGRDQELEKLDTAFNNPGTHIIEFIAWGGVGKTALVSEWMARQSAKGWQGIERYFDWSFYSQGTKEQSSASADNFIAAALTFFGDLDPTHGSPHARGIRLAQLITQQSAVLILDGVEPLQYGVGPLRGHLKDPGLLSLLKCLCHNPWQGLCILTSREPLVELNLYQNKTLTYHPLEHLSPMAGAALLYQSGATQRGMAGIKADNSLLQEVSQEVQGHALTLSLLGSYLKRAHQGDLERRDKVSFQNADKTLQGGHAFRVIAAYEYWLQSKSPQCSHPDQQHSKRLLSLLRLIGLFDRPVSHVLIKALCQPPIIQDLTELLVNQTETNWNSMVQELVELNLLTQDKESLDAHPLLREYFASQLKDTYPQGWQKGHQRVYEYLCKKTPHQPDTLEDLQPLYQAVSHGCQAGLHMQVCDDVYDKRILRGTGSDGFYSWRKLGAIGLDLGAISCFFEDLWWRVSSNLSAEDQSWMLSEAALRLKNLGRIQESLQPMKSSLEMAIEQGKWIDAAVRANNLSEVSLTLGDLKSALSFAESSVYYADKVNNDFQRMARLTTLGDVQHQCGLIEAAAKHFKQGEAILVRIKPDINYLFSLEGFQYCELLLREVERRSWQSFLLTKKQLVVIKNFRILLEEVTNRAEIALKIAENNKLLLHIGISNLSLVRTNLYQELLKGKLFPIHFSPLKNQVIENYLNQAIYTLRKGGRTDYLPNALLTQSWYQTIQGENQTAIASLNEAWEIAERGPMPLYQTDILLYRIRLFACRSQKEPYPWDSTAKEDLKLAEDLIEKHGYHRRDQELKDIKEKLKSLEEGEEGGFISKWLKKMKK